MERAIPQFLVGALCVVTFDGCATAPPPPIVHPAMNPHPEIAAAQTHVDKAIYILKHRTDNDFHGHKAAALRLLQSANRQLHEAMVDAGQP